MAQVAEHLPGISSALGSLFSMEGGEKRLVVALFHLATT
jgi:hypothetical protein